MYCEREDVLHLAAAQDSGAVDDGEDGGEPKLDDYARKDILIDEVSRQDSGVCQRCVELGEVEQQPEEDLEHSMGVIVLRYIGLDILPGRCPAQIFQR